MADILVSWNQDTDPAVASYTVFFAVNGGSPLTLSVPRSAAGDTGGYTANYSSIAGAPALANGDSVVVGVESIDSFKQASPMIPAAGSPVVIAITPAPPTGPVNVIAKQV